MSAASRPSSSTVACAASCPTISWTIAIRSERSRPARSLLSASAAAAAAASALARRAISAALAAL
eukprot:scaffold21168_cov35-Tisochrysis_lutea.AAC.10